ncbi:MAG TPA: TOMM precursor leader peptide-binding protein [Chloroflexia bacterium]|nr:TOMM precursor leader peptide-binding protein [Chloroflexia bacterium]
MFVKPEFKPHFQVAAVEPDSVYLISETRNFLLNGRLYCALAPLLDGKHTADEIVDLLAGDFSAQQVYSGLLQLEKGGYLREATSEPDSAVAAYWSIEDIEAERVTERLKQVKVSVIPCGNAPVRQFENELTALGIQLTDAENSGLWVVLADDYLQPAISELNAKAVQAGTPWLLVKPNGRVCWLGPLFIPGQTGCWECLAQRLRTNRSIQTFVLNHQHQMQKTFPIKQVALPSTVNMALAMAATDVLRWVIRGSNPRLEGQVFTFDTVNLETQSHTLQRRPQCPACGNPSILSRFPVPLNLKSRPKAFTVEGGHRAVSPEVTFEKFKHHISPITGIVSVLEPALKDRDNLIHIYTGDFNRAIAGNSHFRRESFRGSSSGKGASDIQARVSGLAESIERYCGVYRGEGWTKVASYRELGEEAIHPAECLQFSRAQYANRQAWNASHAIKHQVPLPFDETARLEWTPVWSLTNEAFRYLPASFCYYSYPSPEDHFFCRGDSNGSASGNTLEEAILQGFFELVERDSISIWWYNRVKRPAVDLESFNDPYFARIRHYYDSIQRDIWVLDISTDLRIPTFAAVSRACGQESEKLIFGFGAHLDPRIALSRAITELNQVLVGITKFEQSRSVLATIEDRQLHDWLTSATLANQPYLMPLEESKTYRQGDYPELWSNDLLEDVRLCQSMVEENGLEMLVLDQTQPDIGMNVVKVIVPGLRHFWARFAPGRLYDVPVKLGWLKEPTPEEQLNPIPMFF